MAATLFGTRIAETILASAHVRAYQKAGHMSASDPIKNLQNSCEQGAVHICPLHDAPQAVVLSVRVPRLDPH